MSNIRCSARLGIGTRTLYINDMRRSSNQVSFVNFDDDTTVFASGSGINNVHASVNWKPVGVYNTVKASILSVNFSKTSNMIMSNQNNAIYIKIRDSILTNVSKVKFLGVTLAETLICNDHVKSVTTKISQSVGVMRILHCQLLADVMVKLYYSLVHSHLMRYLAWGRTGRTNAAMVHGAHRKARKLLRNDNYMILTFHSIYNYFALLKAFKTEIS